MSQNSTRKCVIGILRRSMRTCSTSTASNAYTNDTIKSILGKVAPNLAQDVSDIPGC